MTPIEKRKHAERIIERCLNSRLVDTLLADPTTSLSYRQRLEALKAARAPLVSVEIRGVFGERIGR